MRTVVRSKEQDMKIAELGYLLVGAPEVAEWKFYAEKVLGAMALDGPADALYVKIDHRAFRIAILPDQDNGLIASGWLVQTEDDFHAARAELTDGGVELVEGTAEGAQIRQVQGYFSFKDPEGHSHELAWGPISDFQPFVSPAAVSGFVTGDMGLGHVVLTAVKDFKAEADFWTSLGGFSLSDILHVPMPDGKARVHFLHCRNRRQHSLAFGELPIPGGCIHIMLEVGSIDDVGRCLDRVAEHGVKVTATLGRHVNDDMISFYMMTPAGFSLEYGFGGKQMDWSEHVVFETTRGSDWGHKFQ